MKANMLEIIISLFTQHVDKAMTGRGRMNKNIKTINKEQVMVVKAVAWLETLVKKTHQKKFPIQMMSSSIRIYSEAERFRLGDLGLSLLDELVYIKVMSMDQREAVLEQIFQLEGDEIPIYHLRWLLFIVLAAEAKSAEELYWLDCLVLKDHRSRTIN